MNKIVITGGHHSAALPVIYKLKAKYPRLEIVWFGHKYSLLGDKNPTLEYKEIVALGIPFYNISAGKLYKTYNLLRLLKIPYGFFQAFYLLARIKPDIVLSFGGYLAAPAVLAAYLLGIPTLTHEQTVVSGYANRFISKLVKRVLVSWKESKKYFPSEKTVVTGLPLRPNVFESASSSFLFENQLPTIYITAGKTGSHKINELIKESMPDLLKITNLIHQTGDYSEFNDYSELVDTYNLLRQDPNTANLGTYVPRKFVFENEIGEVYKLASVVIGRAGAHTCYELYALSKPCVLIPISWVSHNEQFENAKVLEGAKLAIILDESKLSPEILLKAIKDRLAQHAVGDIGESVKSSALAAAALIVDEIEKVYKENTFTP
ncbi:UDP-N-acetylglucosamine--N-acetylmuramyl-(pentapeptide) pyrophosphoryl-undecaprenol N-acetylglucosamine transferase [Patescibacteria group bacterium]|nr:UDP-N-acetylglucosamine--N-acetylmuramyl-(pentapeptide) pyrophosphoryl-undecaprenol N-acetylglucosamine transferase [Patescibacteria group bacterium]